MSDTELTTSQSLEARIAQRRAKQSRNRISFPEIVVSRGNYDIPEGTDVLGNFYYKVWVKNDDGKMSTKFIPMGTSINITAVITERATYAQWDNDAKKNSGVTNEFSSDSQTYPVGIKINGEPVGITQVKDVKSYMARYFPNDEQVARGFADSSSFKYNRILYVIGNFPDPDKAGENKVQIAKIKLRGGKHTQAWFGFTKSLDPSDILEFFPLKLTTEKIKEYKVTWVINFQTIQKDGKVYKNDDEVLTMIFNQQEDLIGTLEEANLAFFGQPIESVKISEGAPLQIKAAPKKMPLEEDVTIDDEPTPVPSPEPVSVASTNTPAVEDHTDGLEGIII